jgi:choline dehydrogenase
MDQRGLSNGTVKLVSANPLDGPRVTFDFFEEHADSDLQAMYESILFAREILAGSSSVGTFTELHPCNRTGGAPACTQAEDKAYLDLQAYSHHPSGACKIGGASDPYAALDSKFRVRGVQRLRVVDASVFPRPPGAFPVLPTIMISGKAAQDILADA